MGTATSSLVTVLAVVALATLPSSIAHADECTGKTPSGGKFALCFDPGNRLSITAGSEGFGGGIAIRHVVHFADEPDLVWRLEHVILDGTHAATTTTDITAVLYRGRYMRHARDGHIFMPALGSPKKVFLPFDVGGLVEVASLRMRDDGTPVRLGIVKTAGLIDFARTRSFRKRLAFGPIASWNVDLMQKPWNVTEQVVAPFSEGMINLHYESSTGRTVADVRLEAGTAWHSNSGWQPTAQAEATFERIVLAINDRPIALTLGARYQSDTSEAIARIGARIVLFDHHDPRVQRLD